MIHTAVVEFLKTKCAITSQIYWGQLPEDADFTKGAIKVFEVPGTKVDNTTQKEYLTFQASIWHIDLYEAHRIASELEKAFIHYAGKITDDEARDYLVVFFLNGTGGELQEEYTVENAADKVWHIPVYFACSHIKCFDDI